jgi:hypothetical protein
MTQKQLKTYIKMLNQVFEIEKKSQKISEENSISRNLSKIKDIFEDDLDENISFILRNPIGDKYDDTRTDLTADISGESLNNLIIIEVIKPIIYIRENGKMQILQRGIVVVQDETTIQVNSKDEQVEKKTSYSTSSQQSTSLQKKQKSKLTNSLKMSPAMQKKLNKRRKKGY